MKARKGTMRRVLAFIFIGLSYLCCLSPVSGKSLVILLGLPGTGTDCVQSSLQKLGWKSTNWKLDNGDACKNLFPVHGVTVGTKSDPVEWPEIENSSNCFVGTMVQSAISKKLPPLKYLTDMGYDAIIQMGSCEEASGKCIYPQIDALEKLVTAYPNAHFIYTRRQSVVDYVQSLANSHMLQNFKEAGYLNRSCIENPSM